MHINTDIKYTLEKERNRYLSDWKMCKLDRLNLQEKLNNIQRNKYDKESQCYLSDQVNEAVPYSQFRP